MRIKLIAKLKNFIKNNNNSVKTIKKYINNRFSIYLTKIVNNLVKLYIEESFFDR